MTKSLRCIRSTSLDIHEITVPQTYWPISKVRVNKTIAPSAPIFTNVKWLGKRRLRCNLSATKKVSSYMISHMDRDYINMCRLFRSIGTFSKVRFKRESTNLDRSCAMPTHELRLERRLIADAVVEIGDFSFKTNFLSRDLVYVKWCWTYANELLKKYQYFWIIEVCLWNGISIWEII